MKKEKLKQKLEIPDQKEIWDNISRKWCDYRNHSVPEVVEFLKDKKGKILDLGCGSGRNFVKADFETYGVDFSRKMIELAEKYAKKEKLKAKLFKKNAWEMDFPDNYFDSAVFIATLHCIPDEKHREESLKQLARVLKPGSRALITVWDKEQDRFKDMEKEILLPWGTDENGKRVEYMRYYYLYDKEEILALLKKYFKIIKIYSKDVEGSRFKKKNLIIEVEKV